MSTYKLYYFNGRGRAEFARLVFAAAGEKYEDVRFEREKWPEHKSEMPLGQVPVLEYNGERIPQSIAIARFLAKQFHLAGKDHFEQAKADAVVDTVNDALVKYIPARFESDEKKKEEALKKFFDDELPKHLQNLEVLGKTYGEGSAFFVGNQLTWADLFFYEVSQTLVNSHGDCLDKYPWLKQNRAEVEKNPRIAEYLKSRPETPF